MEGRAIGGSVKSSLRSRDEEGLVDVSWGSGLFWWKS